jgi:hypothetical protein
VNNANLSLSHQSITNQPGLALVTTDRALTPLMRVQQVAALATNERHKTAHYGIVHLAAEFQRQSQIIAKKGGVTPEEKSRLQSLTLDCMTKLQLVNVYLHDRLVEILLR